MSFGKCFTKFRTKVDVRSLFDAHFSTDTTKVLSLLARYVSFSTSKCHKNLTQHDREIDNQTVKFSDLKRMGTFELHFIVDQEAKTKLFRQCQSVRL